MIKGIVGGSNVVIGGGSVSLPYVNQNNSNPMQGMMRVWGNDMQVFDGSNWVTMASSYASVDLSPDVQSLVQWAREQRDKQWKREALIKDNPALQKAMEAISRAESNFDILAKFVEHDTNGQVQPTGP